MLESACQFLKKNLARILIAIVLNLQKSLRKINILTILSLLSCEHAIYLSIYLGSQILSAMLCRFQHMGFSFALLNLSLNGSSF